MPLPWKDGAGNLHTWGFRSAPLPTTNALARRALTTEEVTRLVHRFLAPPWISCGVSTSGDLLRQRAELGLDAAGALWVATADRREFTGVAIPLGVVPWENILTADFDEGRKRWFGGEVRRGWRSILEHLLRRGYLRRGDRELLFLVGRSAEWKSRRT